MASYYLFQQDESWKLRTEFAWSLRNALVLSFPYLDEEKVSDEDYSDCVLDYLDINMEIILDGNILKYDKIKQIPGSHGHSFVFIIDVNGPVTGQNLQIRNHCMTEIYKKQKNHVIVKTKEHSLEHILTKNIKTCSFDLS